MWAIILSDDPWRTWGGRVASSTIFFCYDAIVVHRFWSRDSPTKVYGVPTLLVEKPTDVVGDVESYVNTTVLVKNGVVITCNRPKEIVTDLVDRIVLKEIPRRY